MPELFSFNSSEEKQRASIKRLGIGLIFIIILIIVISVAYLIINKDKTASIEILVAPSSAAVKIGEGNFNTNTTIKIKPGTYEVKISKDGFVEYTGEIEAKDGETSYLYEFLTPNDDNKNYYKNNESEYSLIQTISDRKDAVYLDGLISGSDKIFSITPYNNYDGGYKINTSTDEESNKTIIKIYLYTCGETPQLEEFKNNALDYLKKNSIDLDKYIIEYSNC